AFAEYLSIPYRNVYKVDPSIPEEVISTFDPLGNAVHTALSWDLVAEDVLITGAGPIGCMAAAVAKLAGARHVVVPDVDPYRRAPRALQGSPGRAPAQRRRRPPRPHGRRRGRLRRSAPLRRDGRQSLPPRTGEDTRSHPRRRRLPRVLYRRGEGNRHERRLRR